MSTLQWAALPADDCEGVDGGEPHLAAHPERVVAGVVEMLRRRPEPRAARSTQPGLATVTDLRVSRVRAQRAYDRLRTARLDDVHALATAWDELTSIELESRRSAATSG
jgi:hypothetical protein